MAAKESADEEWLDWVERQAGMLRRELELGDMETLDPYELAKKMGFIKLMPIEAVQNIEPEILERLLVRNSGWSAGSLVLPDGTVIVIMNPSHSKARKRATLMEEIAHIHLAHTPSVLAVGPDNLTTRTYDKQQEKEAYWVGAAALVPIAQLQAAQRLRHTIKHMATYFEVSRDLVRFRCAITHINLAD